MYWGQVATALTAAVAAGSLLHSRGHTIEVAIIAGVVTYFLIRWVIAWGYRVQYWYRRGTKDYYSTSCPDCGQYIYRRRRDWILSCGRCGWTAGYPIMRWITQSVPARQLRRTVVGPQLVVVIISIALLTSGVAASFDATSVFNSSKSEVNDNEVTDISVVQETSASSNEDSYNLTEVEVHFLRLLNEERQARGLQLVEQHSVLTEMAENHSANMAKHGYVGHIQPDGDTIASRYRERGLLPKCRLPIQDTNEFYEGTENVAQTHVGTTVLGDAKPAYIDSEQDLAKHLFTMWMHSEGHREAMLVASADQAGLGVNITSSDEVYAALELC